MYRHIARPARRLTVLALLLLVAACDGTGPEDRVVVAEFSFAEGDREFQAAFTDYPVGREEDVEFVADHRSLPPPLADQGGALYHSGENISDDLFMFFRRRIAGLDAGSTYRATFTLRFASDTGEDCTVGAGTLVLLKAGAASVEPMPVVEDGGVRLNVDKGNQANRGEAAVILGDIRNGEPGCGEQVPFALETVDSGGESVVVTADEAGGVWVFFGSESAFEVGHELYFTSFEVTFRRQ